MVTHYRCTNFQKSTEDGDKLMYLANELIVGNNKRIPKIKRF
jgi:hypothetical protein